MEFDYLVFAGRFSPFTNAHKYVVREALSRAKKLVILVGSSFTPRSFRNPWTFEERADMIRASMRPEEMQRIQLLPLPDYDYADHLWVKRVHELTNVFVRPHHKVGLIGHSKDASSYYLKMFPDWGSVNITNFRGINATDVRNAYFVDHFAWENTIDKVVAKLVPSAVMTFLEIFRIGNVNAFDELLAERQHLEEYASKWGYGPFLTADSVVVQAGHVLLVIRGGEYGRGLWALPGGFADSGETLLQAAVRELAEETNLDMPKGAIEGSLVKAELFDAPHRDGRARIITQAHLFNLDNEVTRRAAQRGWSDKVIETGLNLTKIKAGDDAAHAQWVKLADLSTETLFSDHFHIIQKMIGSL